MAMSQRCNR
jgi:hypothetical protein